MPSDSSYILKLLRFILITNNTTRVPSHNRSCSEPHFKIYKCKCSCSEPQEVRVPSHKLQNLGDLLLIFFSYSFFNLFFNQQEKSIPRLPTTEFSENTEIPTIFGVYRSFCRRSNSLIAHVFFWNTDRVRYRSPIFFFREDPLVFSYRKSLPRCAIKFVTQPTRRNRSQQRLLVGWDFSFWHIGQAQALRVFCSFFPPSASPLPDKDGLFSV